jgi:hypothetical protein
MTVKYIFDINGPFELSLYYILTITVSMNSVLGIGHCHGLFHTVL